ncbi:MAG: hypothetical protein ACO1N3_02680 [Gammaproteobacteria bacterium]
MSTRRFEKPIFDPRLFSDTNGVANSLQEEIKRRVFGLDFDGCTDKVIARTRLRDDITNFVIAHPEIEELDFIISSLRQEFLLDYYNACVHNSVDDQGRTQSCTELEKWVAELKAHISAVYKREHITSPIPKITFHPLLLSDIFNYLADGITFGKMKECKHYTEINITNPYITVNNLNGCEVNLAYFNQKIGGFERVGPDDSPPLAFCDISKILLLWIQMQYFAQIHKGQPFVFRFIDDNLTVINEVNVFFAKHRYLIPGICSFETMYMSSNFHHYPPKYKPSKAIKGEGVIQENYRAIAYDIVATIAGVCEKNDYEGKKDMIKDMLINAYIPEHDYDSDCSSGSLQEEIDDHARFYHADELRLAQIERPSVSVERTKLLIPIPTLEQQELELTNSPLKFNGGY